MNEPVGNLYFVPNTTDFTTIIADERHRGSILTYPDNRL
jgi:hypothetical protein